MRNLADYKTGFINDNLENHLAVDNKILFISSGTAQLGDSGATYDNVIVTPSIQDLTNQSMFDYNLIVVNDLISYDSAASLRSKLNRLYHLVTQPGTLMVSLEISAGASADTKLISKDDFFDLVENSTNMEIYKYQLFTVEEAGIQTYLNVILKTV